MDQIITGVPLTLSTPLLADACVRLGIGIRLAPPGIRPIIRGIPLAGPALPVRHYGSVDIFLEAIEDSEQGDVLVIDNQGRSDEGCIGDLTVLEAQSAGLAGITLWGCHRDTGEILQTEFPVFTYGAWPAGPLRLDTRHAEALLSARFGELTITRDDFVFADDDGVLFLPTDRLEQITTTALEIQDTERHQAAMIKSGTSLRKQLKFADYLSKRKTDPSYSFRKHLKAVGGAIEE
ncbi:MAG: RraA family protein [Thermodesulfobacteriota bacterium]